MKATRTITQMMLVSAICIFTGSPTCWATESANPLAA
jgi:hypothetical protein